MSERADVSGPQVLLVTDSLEGGLARAVVAEAQELLRSGIHAVVAAPIDTVEEFEFIQVPVPGAIRQAGGMVRAVRAIRRVSRHRRFRLIHAHGLRSFAAARLARPLSSVVVTYHGAPPESRLRRLALRAVGRMSYASFSVAPMGICGWQHVWHWSPEAMIEPSHGQQPEAAGSHPLAISATDADFIRSSAPTRAFLSSCKSDTPTGTTFGWFGRLEAPKRFDMWLRAVAHVAASLPDVRGVVVGDGPLEDEWREVAGRYTFPIEFVGRTDPDSAFRLMDVFLTWSDSEGVPFAMQEAISRGIPCYTNDLPGPRSFLGDDSECILVATDDARLAASCTPQARLDIAEAQYSRMEQLQSGPSPTHHILKLLGHVKELDGVRPSGDP